jgi:uncharacterized phiE125 gp8 family phage protein
MSLKLITPPAIEPVDLDTAKLHLRVEHTTDDTIITALIKAAREFAEHECNRALITQTWELALDAFPAGAIRAPKANLLTVVSLKYDDPDGVEQTLATDAYTLDTHEQPGWIVPEIDTDWPETIAAVNAVRVRFTAGYGPAASDVPQGIKTWLLLRVGTLYRNRDELAETRFAPNPLYDRMLDPFRVYGH